MLQSRNNLFLIYDSIYKKLKDRNINPKELISEKNRKLRMSEEAYEIFSSHIKNLSLEKGVFLRALNDQQRYFLNGSFLCVALVLNELLPRFKDLEASEKQVFKEVTKLPTNTVISDKDLIFKFLKDEKTSYIKRLLMSSLDLKNYYMPTNSLSLKDIEDMELISANWVLKNETFESEVLKVLSLTDIDGVPLELRDTDVPRYKFIREISPSLFSVSSFKRSDTSPFARFVVLLPTLLTRYIGLVGHSNCTTDCFMDLLEAMMTFTKTLQHNAEEASRVRQMLHHGHPVYKDLIQLSKNQTALMSWSFEGIVFRFSHLLTELFNHAELDCDVITFLNEIDVVSLYARHKGGYLER